MEEERLGFGERGRLGRRPRAALGGAAKSGQPPPSPPHYIGGNPQVLVSKSSNKTPTMKTPIGGKTYSRGKSHSRWDSHPFLGGLAGHPWGVHLGLLPFRVGWLYKVESLRDSTFHGDFFRTFLEPSRTCHKCTGSFPNLEYDFLYMNLILRTIPDLLVMSWIPSETPNKTSNSIPYSISS